MQRENVFYLRGRANPVLCREAKYCQESNIAVGANADNLGQILFASGVTFRAWQATTFRPTTVSVHDAGDMDG